MASKEAENFFSVDKETREGETDDFIKHMQRPREEVKAPDFELGDDEDEDLPKDAPSTGEGTSGGESDADLVFGASDKVLAGYLLLEFDRVMAFLMSWISQGKHKPEHYRQRKSTTEHPEQVELMAHVVHKYSLSMSPESRLFLSLGAMYGPVAASAYMDGQKAKKEQEKKPQEVERPSSKKGPVKPID